MVNLASSYQPASTIWPVLSIATYGVNLFFNYKLVRRTTQRDKVGVLFNPKFAAIWGVIVAAFSTLLLYLLFVPRFTVEGHLWIIASNFASLSWVFSASSDLKQRNLLMLAAMLSLLFILWNCWRSASMPPIKSQLEFSLIKNAISLYMGWITMGTCINMAFVVVKVLKVPDQDNNKYFWIYSPLLVLTVVYCCLQCDSTGSFSGNGSISSFLTFFAAAAWGVTGVVQALSK